VRIDIMASVKYQTVTKRFGDVAAVNDLSIDIKDKEFLVFVGPSGCGKTTSLRLLAGLEEIDEGDIYIGDECVNDVLPKDRDIAMVFQNYALYPHMSVYQNLSFALKLRRMDKSEIDSRVKEAASVLHIGHLLERKPKQLSGGERQRVALGRAIVRHPKVFLMDEPLSNLDAKLRVQTRAELIKLHERLQATFVYVTHDQVEAMTMGSRIVVMNQGVLQQIDTPQNLYDSPANVFVAGFIGSPAMNFFGGTLAGTDGELVVETKRFRIPLSPERSRSVKGRVGREIILGIRPEDIHIPSDVPNGVAGARIQAQLDVKEPMGNEIFLHFTTATEPFVARVSPRARVSVGTDVELLLDMNKMHLFDRETELSLL
jgi:multiple sugar transport system ATP-binding protein